MKELKTNRLSLRSFEEKDADLLLSWENSVDAWASSMTLNPLSHKFIKDYILYDNQAILRDGKLIFLAEELESNKAIGYLQLLDYEPLHQKLGLGIYISESFRGLGYAKELIAFAKSYAFDILHCRMLYAESFASNKSACRLFESMGFKQTAILPDWYWVNRRYESLVYYQIWSQ